MEVDKSKPAPPGLEQAYAIERKIIDAHDATVLFDPSRSHIITEGGVRDLRIASAWLAQKTN